MKNKRKNKKRTNVLLKNSLQEIKLNKKRFISILLMALLGVGFFAGLVATGPDMRDSLDKFLDYTNTYDIDIVSTLGVTDDDIEELKKLNNISNIEGIYSKDVIVKTNDSEYVFKTIELTDKINGFELVDGKIPEKDNECVVEQSFIKVTNYKIGDTLIFEDPDECFNNTEFKITGIIESPLYISEERGTTSLGNGNINFYMYVKENVFEMDYYTNIYMKVANTKEMTIKTDEYNNSVDAVVSEIEKIKADRENARYEYVINTAEDELQENIDKFEKEKKDGEKEIKKAENDLKKAEKKIKDSEAELASGKKTAKSEIEKARNKLTKERKTLKQAEKEYNAGLSEYKKGLKTFNSTKKKLQANIKTIETNIIALEKLEKEKNNQIAEIEKEISNGDTSNENKLPKLKKNRNELQAQIKGLKSNKTTINKQITLNQNKLTSTKKKLDSAYKKIQNGYKQIKSAEDKIDKEEVNTNNKFKKAEKEIKNAKTELKNGKTELQTEKNKFKKEIAKVEKEIADAKEDIKDIKKPTWYIQTREDNAGLESFINSVDSISNIAKVFPILFFVVAILISSTSMTRMVEEERIEIGTLKALGYSNFSIMNKYIIYSLLSCIIGGTIGMFIGFILLPEIIWENYDIIYYLPKFYSEIRLEYGILGIGIAIICICGATIQSAYKELKNTPSVLMRPKVPKAGKRIYLENIPFIWKRMNFSAKTTMRNLFRYKKRGIMTILGITGCTALILAGFGLKDSITDIVDLQYGRVFDYDISIALKQEDKQIIEELRANEDIKYLATLEGVSGTIKFNDKTKDTNILVVENKEEFKNIANLYNIDNEELVDLSSDSICVSDKLADLMKIEAGDTIIISDSDNNEYKYKVSAIVENYVGHYVFMDKELYESTGKEYKTNTIFVKNNDNVSEETNNQLSKTLLEDSSVASVVIIEDTLKNTRNLLKSLDLVVMILIVASALLAFVVLYNLANVNISERIREIATLKVLGFYDKEVDSYINKESIILTVVGILLGLAVGYFLTDFVITTCETDSMRFGRNILPTSYALAALITVVFSAIVNFSTHFVLKKVNMVESLKSIE